MRHYTSEADARNDIESVLKQFIPSAALSVFERIPRDEVVDDVVFGVRMKASEPKIIEVVKALKDFHLESEKSLRYEGTKLDMMAEIQTEYILVRATVIS